MPFVRSLATLALIVGTPAAAVTFTVIPGATAAVPRGNDFRRDLQALGLTRITTRDAQLLLTRPTRLQFDYFGAESGYTNRLVVDSDSFAETDKRRWSATPMFSLLQPAGAVDNWLFTSNRGARNRGIGTHELAIFLPQLQPGERYSTNILYLGFDDQITNRDDDFDDMMVRVMGVPEPTSWAMLIAGFGLVGAVQRRRAGLAIAG